MRYSSNPFSRMSRFYDAHKRLSLLFILVFLCFSLYICGVIGEKSTGQKNSTGEISGAYSYPEDIEEFNANFSYLEITELDQYIESVNVIDVDLSQKSGTYEITEAGNYHLKGELKGSIHIFAKEQNVHLYLDNVDIEATVGPAIYCESADKIIITLVEGSNNIISDSGDYRDEDEADACIYCEQDVTFNGTGSLKVNGYYKDAIRSKDILKIIDGQYIIKSKRTALQGNDGIVVENGDISISSEKYAFKTTKSGNYGRGNLMLTGGEYSIIAGRYAFVVNKGDLYIYNSTIYSRSILADYDVAGGKVLIQDGCINE